MYYPAYRFIVVASAVFVTFPNYGRSFMRCRRDGASASASASARWKLIGRCNNRRRR